jgi:multidrug efflux system outer membrane protein
MPFLDFSFRRLAAGLALLASVVMAACSTSRPPDHVDFAVPAKYREDATSGTGAWEAAKPAEGADRGTWWLAFGDPDLTALIERAAHASPSLAVAAAHVKAAQAQYGVVDSERGLHVTGEFGPSRSYGTEFPPGTTWLAGFAPSYEVDLFGRLSDASRAAKESMEAQQAAYRSTLLALQSDVAQQYFALRSLDTELQVLDDTIELRKKGLQLVQHRYDAGDTSELDVAQARTELADAQAERAAVARTRGQRDHALAVLLGEAPETTSLPATPLHFQAVVVPAGLPSDLLERRPDIVEAQRSLAAASAQVGAAHAAFFPSLTLTGLAGYESSELHNLFHWSSRAWILGPFLGTIASIPLLDGGHNDAVLAGANADYERAVASYREQVLVGFQDVEDSLTAIRTLDEQLAFERQAGEAANRAEQLAQSRYRNGSTSYLEVIDAQRSSLSAKRNIAQVEGLRALASVALIKSLGGGWQTTVPPTALSETR